MPVLIEEAIPGRPYWWQDVDFRECAEELPKYCDVLVIGAGYTGLSAALVAADADASVVVLDAGQPGHGASTRNGGMFGAHPKLSWQALARQFGPDTADALFGEANPALSFVKNLIKREKIKCDFQESGRIQLAWTQRHMDDLRLLAKSLREKTDVKFRLVERDGLEAEIATDRYFGGMVFEEHCGIDPQKFHAGLLDAVIRRDVPVIGNCAVREVETALTRHNVRTDLGEIKPKKIILATNGYSSDIFRWFQKRVFPLPSYLIATEKLPVDMIRKLAPGGRMMVETRARRSYYRASPDGKRILFGGRASMRDIPLEKAADRLHQTMTEIWPSMADVSATHVWTGNTGYAFGEMPAVGEAEGLIYAMGYSGSGTVMAPYLGAKAGYLALGDKRAKTAFSEVELRTSMLHSGGTPHFLRAADLWYRHVVDRRETRRGRSGG